MTVAKVKAEALFISDLHLSPQQPRTVAAFLALLETLPDRTNHLYILGDLFDYWAGDDDRTDPFLARVLGALADTARAGVELYFMGGNRDFLVGLDTARIAGLTLLADPHLLRSSAGRVLLSHGDALCTDDLEYQAYRMKVRDPVWLAGFLTRPLVERKAFIAELRAGSDRGKQYKSAVIMDVNPRAVGEFVSKYGAQHFIHGHTHRPGHHVAISPEFDCQRWVLPDWDYDVSPARGGGLALVNETFEFFAH